MRMGIVEFTSPRIRKKVRAILSHFMAEFPNNADLDYLESLRGLGCWSYPEGTMLWQPYEDWDADYFVDHVTSLYNSVINVWTEQ